MQKLVIFDVDGTLVRSVKIDTRCYVRSIEELFDIKNIDTRWHLYKTATDSAILDEIFMKALSRRPSPSEIRQHVEKFTELLYEYYKKGTLFREVKGARDILARLKHARKWKTGIASGGWRVSTLLKLRLSGFDIAGIPFVSGSDNKIRENIVKKCIIQSRRHYGIRHFGKIVLVGDAIWDLKSALKLKIGFLGVNTRGALKNTGGCLTMRDFSDYKKFIMALEKTKPVIKMCY